MGLGIDVTAWPYWKGAEAALSRSIFFNITSVMNLGIMAGALMAAGAAGRFAPAWKIPARTLIAALLGGLLLGYGAALPRAACMAGCGWRRRWWAMSRVSGCGLSSA